MARIRPVRAGQFMKRRLSVHSKKILAWALLAVTTVISVTGCGIYEDTPPSGLQIKEEGVNDENKYDILKSLKIRSREMPLVKGEVPEKDDSEKVSYEMPGIDIYAPIVKGSGEKNAEVVLCAKEQDSEVIGIVKKAAEIYNENNADSVTVRVIEPALVKDFLSSGASIPDGIIIENEIFGKYFESEGTELQQIAKTLIPDAAGVAISKNVYMPLKDRIHNEADIARGTVEGNLMIAYSSPLNNPTGLNFAVSMLSSFDEANPNSMEAVENFGVFQGHVADVSYSPSQMMSAAKNGRINAFVIEKQKYIKNDFAEDFVFIPVGERQDYPLYCTASTDENIKSVLEGFAGVFSEEPVNSMINEYGFNTEDYETPDSMKDLEPSEVSDIVKYWKEAKNAGKNVAAVFVSDVSGSMDGIKMKNLRKSLYSAMGQISPATRTGFISFNGDVHIELPIGPFNEENQSYFAGAVERLDTWHSINGTATVNAVLEAVRVLYEDEEVRKGNCRPAIILLADGQTNVGHSIDETAALLRAFGYPVYAIGYGENPGEDIDEGELKKIADVTGGEYINSSAEDIGYILNILFESEL